MPEGQSALSLLRLGRLDLGPGLRALQPGAASGLVATAMIEVPDSGSDRQYAWEVAWSDAAREASGLGAGQRTAEALTAGAGRLSLTAPERWSRRRMLSSAGYRPS
jgi:hypothetical protein